MKSRLTDRQKHHIATRQATSSRELEPGTVVTHHGTELIIETRDGVLRRGKARRTLGALTTGDRVGWHTGEDERIVIEQLHPRSNTLIRPDTHGKPRLMAANIDQVLIVVSSKPWMNPSIIERTIVATLDLPATPLILLNKIDLLDETDPAIRQEMTEALDIWRQQGIEILPVSTKTGVGIPELKAALADNVSMMIGLSGVGKTSLARCITAQASKAAIQALSEHSQEGQHTTRNSTLYRLDDLPGGLIDAPGVRDFAVAAQNPQAIDRAFPDIVELAAGCRFHNCTHDQEPDCAVRSAVAEQQLDARRFENYQSLKRERVR
ncbi:ribosome small subunit-dependent GTPase A [Halothiobacillus diazotrophicus]|uniref:Small ribosomal subunit biogenesis GTPase RsgA n=1 Tax=Halothiobacillus diazotrophicus TaxID=1860122 RepID=A0A191ZFA2_9GAMM|nr:ribosome small subunit-dependent GTPase A [Halothiobacillus diazotrophicus]ANJ66543.1 ribosome small subunit-dependent GTPase A [Halothiobacillus diazotrophicus]